MVRNQNRGKLGRSEEEGPGRDPHKPPLSFPRDHESQEETGNSKCVEIERSLSNLWKVSFLFSFFFLTRQEVVQGVL